jgi:hypothetical protein
MAAEEVEKLAKACKAAYKEATNSCSHAVWHVLKAMLDPKEPYRQANELVDWMNKSPAWGLVDLEKGFALANEGKVVVGGKKETGHGHVIVIYPGDKKLNGGYVYYYKAGNKNLTMEGKTMYPRCLSTSNGSWPGAKSDGDKTVWDPWGKDAKFNLVRFWSPVEAPDAE